MGDSVKFPTALDRKARDWVQSNYENVGMEVFQHWTVEDYWFFVEEVYIGGAVAFRANNA